VLKNLDNLSKGICQKEWDAFYQCYLKVVRISSFEVNGFYAHTNNQNRDELMFKR
jgi:hypothetical protein